MSDSRPSAFSPASSSSSSSSSISAAGSAAGSATTSASTIAVTLPDGTVQQHPAGVTIAQIAFGIGPKLGKAAIGGVVSYPAAAATNGTATDQASDDLAAGPAGKEAVIDVHTPLDRDCSLRIVTLKSDEGLQVLRHSTAHVLASAVQRLFPGTKIATGPAIDDGFYYDFDRGEDGAFSDDDLAAIEAEMVRIVKENKPFERAERNRSDAQAQFTKADETYKLQVLERIPEGDPITTYTHGDWFDLCRGPHVPSTGALKAFKLTRVAGAYWRGDERNPMLTRIYGTAFWSKADLEAHLALIEEAKKRDHRRLGKDLDLFSFQTIAPAMPYFHPKGALLVRVLTDFIRNYYEALGFDEVVTPQVTDVDLFKKSGHYDNYRENMFFCQIDEREFGLKPMNCPGHTLIYKSGKRSYRDLPIRYADFGRLHRYERSGVTAGLTRVRSFCQDDAHIFCTEEQIADEIAGQILMIQDVYKHFGFDVRIEFSTRPEKSIGREDGLSDEERSEWNGIWGQAEDLLREALSRAELDYDLNPGDGAFYGPKIDCHVKDALGRWYQLGTIQLDFSMPRRLNLSYVNPQGSTSRPVMIHRAVLGSLERFIGILIEHCAGDFPLWLAPEQVRVLAINDDLLEYGEKVAQAFEDRGLRVVLDRRSEKLGFKIRDAELHKVPFVAVLGAKEKEAGTVSLRARKKQDLGQLALDQAVTHVVDAAAVPRPTASLRQKVRRGVRSLT